MMHAYDKNIVYRAQTVLGWFFDTCVNYYKIPLKVFYQMFLNSPLCKKFENGDPFLIMGKSGREMAFEVLCENGYEIEVPDYFTVNRSEEYWLGWVLAYYQWYKGISFSRITETIEIDEFLLMYDKYHEMDISQFVDGADEIRQKAQDMSRLKRLRKYAKLSQKELAEISGVPLRTIQQYEQRQKDINRANVDYVIKLAKALSCDTEAILEEW